MAQLVDLYILLASHNVPNEIRDSMVFPASLRRSASALPLVPVLSVELPIDPSACYEGFAHFVGGAFCKVIRKQH